MIALIVAYTKNKVIGKNGKIPWNLKNEKKRFKNLTTNNIVIMGRKTFEEIGKPLPNRTTIVLSKTKKYNFENCFTAKSLKEALEFCKKTDKNIFIAGGEKVYKEALPFVEKMYITEIDAYISGDTYFPEFNEKKFIKSLDEEFCEELSYKYFTYTRII